MSDEIVKVETVEGTLFEVGPKLGTTTALKQGYHMIRFQQELEDFSFNMTCAVKGRRATRLLTLCADGVMPTISSLLSDFGEFQKSWVVAKNERLEPSFGAHWQERGANLQLRWIAQSSIEAYLTARGLNGPLFDTMPNAVNSSLWLQGILPDGSNIAGLVPLGELIIRPPSALLTNLLSGKATGMIAWRQGKHSDVAWKFMKFMPMPHCDAIAATEWKLTEIPEL